MSPSCQVQCVGLYTLSEDDLEVCVSLIAAAEGVIANTVRKELPQATLIALARTDDRAPRIVGVGAIRQKRQWYATEQAENSGCPFDPSTLELGYVAIDTGYGGAGLEARLVSALAARHKGPLWAAASDERIQQALRAAGFERRGQPWEGDRAMLSLWLKP